MRITVIRDTLTEASTGSLILVDGAFFCYGLEPPKTPDPAGNGRVCIPAGEYEVVPHDSPLGEREWGAPKMPMVADVPGRSFVLLHPGNFPKDTEGCLLLGERRSEDWVGPSVPIWRELFTHIRAAWAADEKVTVAYRELAQ